MPSEAGEEMVRERTALFIFTAVMSLIGAMLPSVLFVAPVPLAVLIFRHGLRVGIFAALVSAIVTGIFMGSTAPMILVLLVLGIGVAIGEALRDKLTLNQILGVSWGIAFLSFFGLYATARLLFDLDLVGETVNMWMSQLDKVANTPGGAALPKVDTEDLIAHLRIIMPGMLALSAAMISLLNYWLVGRWLARLGAEVPWFPPFDKWRFPWYMAWGYIVGVGLPLLRGVFQSPELFAVAANLELVFYFVFLVQGLAVIWFYLSRFRMRRTFQVLLALASLFLTPALVFVGLLDSWFDLRRLHRREA